MIGKYDVTLHRPNKAEPVSGQGGGGLNYIIKEAFTWRFVLDELESSKIPDQVRDKGDGRCSWHYSIG